MGDCSPKMENWLLIVFDVLKVKTMAKLKKEKYIKRSCFCIDVNIFEQ